MKIEELIMQYQQKNAWKALSPLQRKVMEFFERHRGEVFRYGDMQVVDFVKEKPSAVNWSIWVLLKKGFLAKTKVGKSTYFGIPEDIRKLEEGLK